MRCLYIVPNSPISPNYSGGGSAIYYEQLESLRALGIELFLWHFTYESRRAEFESFIARETSAWESLEQGCSEVIRSNVPDQPTFVDRIANKLANTVSENEVENPLIRGKLFPICQKLVSRIEPDFVWAQHFLGAQTAILQKEVPVVYSHHDWLYKIKFIGDHNAAAAKSKKIEEYTAKQAAAVVSGSKIECDQLEKIGCKNVHYVPLAYDAAELFQSEGEPTRIVHLGGMATTANRIGLERFFEVAFPKLEIDPSQFWVVGDLKAASDSLKQQLADVHCTGFVDDLGTVMRRHDIHIIPWEHDTGQRTRLVQAFNYGQAVVAMRKSVSCYPEAIHGENCLLIDSLEEMPASVHRLLKDDRLRKNLGDNARSTFETSFTREVLLEKYAKVVASVT